MVETSKSVGDCFLSTASKEKWKNFSSSFPSDYSPPVGIISLSHSFSSSSPSTWNASQLATDWRNGEWRKLTKEWHLLKMAKSTTCGQLSISKLQFFYLLLSFKSSLKAQAYSHIVTWNEHRLLSLAFYNPATYFSVIKYFLSLIFEQMFHRSMITTRKSISWFDQRQSSFPLRFSSSFSRSFFRFDGKWPWLSGRCRKESDRKKWISSGEFWDTWWRHM